MGSLWLLALAHARAGDPQLAVAAGNDALDRAVGACVLTNLDATSRAPVRWRNLDSVRRFNVRVADTLVWLRHDAAGIATTARG